MPPSRQPAACRSRRCSCEKECGCKCAWIAVAALVQLGLLGLAAWAFSDRAAVDGSRGANVALKRSIGSGVDGYLRSSYLVLGLRASGLGQFWIERPLTIGSPRFLTIGSTRPLKGLLKNWFL